MQPNSQKFHPKNQPKTSRCRHGRRRAPASCEFCLAKLAHSIFARTQKYCANPLKQVMMQVLSALHCKNILVRSTWVECSCVRFLPKLPRAAPIPRRFIPRTSIKRLRCHHGRRRAPFLCEFCLAKLAQSIFARTQNTLPIP